METYENGFKDALDLCTEYIDSKVRWLDSLNADTTQLRSLKSSLEKEGQKRGL